MGDVVKGLEPRPELTGAEQRQLKPPPVIAKADLNLDGEFKGLALKEDLGVKEVQARAERILAEGDIQLPTGLLTETEGQLRPVTRSAREILQEADQDLSAGAILKKCLTGG